MWKIISLIISDPKRAKRIIEIVNALWPQIEELLSLLPHEDAKAVAKGALRTKVSQIASDPQMAKPGRGYTPPPDDGIRPRS